jgi:peptidoglycan-associated lipoprotein
MTQRVLLLSFLLLSGACTSTDPKPQAKQPAPSARPAQPGAPVAAAPSSDAAPDDARDPRPERAIYFEFGSASLSGEGQERLKLLAAWLGRHKEARVRIAGHCDERGTAEYNLALGDQRARIAGDTLQRLGVDKARIDVVSRGEEEPAVEGSNEEAWAMNRRDEITVTIPVASDGPA